MGIKLLLRYFQDRSTHKTTRIVSEVLVEKTILILPTKSPITQSPPLALARVEFFIDMSALHFYNFSRFLRHNLHSVFWHCM
jgi:hypothetical protein